MTKLAAALPDGHGLDAVRRHLLETPRRRHIAIGLVSTKSVTDDYDKGEKEPTAAFRQLEARPTPPWPSNCSPAPTTAVKVPPAGESRALFPDVA